MTPALPPKLRYGTIVLVPAYTPSTLFIPARITNIQRPTFNKHYPRLGWRYHLETLEPHPHRFIRRNATEIILPIK